jgi:hypothetical protein
MADTSAGNGLLVIERILRDRAGVWRDIVDERGLRQLIVQMLTSSAVSLALYGAVLGASYGWQQALSSFIKLPLLFLATLCICLPTLYLFNLVFGARLSVVQAVALIMVSVTVTSVLTLAFAPISLFFLVTAQSYAFFKLLNVAILTLTAIVGLRFLIGGMLALNEHQELETLLAVPAPATAVPADAYPAAEALTPAGGALVDAVPAGVAVPAQAAAAGPLVAAVPAQPLSGAQPLPGQQLPPDLMQPNRNPPLTVPVLARTPGRPMAADGQPRQASMGLLYIWILLFGFVGTQLGWTLRPFFGDPGQPFGLFRHLSGTFYGDILNTIGQLLGV